MLYPFVFASCLTLALALPTHPPERTPSDDFIPGLNPDQQPTLEGCVQWFIRDNVQLRVSSITITSPSAVASSDQLSLVLLADIHQRGSAEMVLSLSSAGSLVRRSEIA